MFLAVSTLSALLIGVSQVSANELKLKDVKEYEVKAGDTLAQISKDKFGTTAYVEEIAHVNGITDVDLIFTGDTIKFEGVKELGEDGIAPTEKVFAPVEYVPVSYESSYESSYETYTTPVYSTGYQGSVVLSNGNTAGAIGTEAAARMAAATGVPQSTWEHIIARESNGQVNAYNPSGAAGLFQTMPGWGSTATVEDQIQSALNAYNAQGLSAWGY